MASLYSLSLLCVALLASFSFLADSLPLPYDEFAYYQARNELASAYDHVSSLNAREHLVSLYMEKMKQKEFNLTSAFFYPARPIESEVTAVTCRSLYKFLRKLPKGGNLHMHETQMLDRTKLLEIVFASDEFEWLYICDKANDPACKTANCSCYQYSMDYFPNGPTQPGWVYIKANRTEWTIEKIVRKTTLTGMLNETTTPVYPTDSNGRWAVANSRGLFGYYDTIINYNVTRAKYMRACLESMLDENVQLVEFRRGSFGTLYYFDQNGNKVLLSDVQEVDEMLAIKEDFASKNPSFIDFVYIIYSSRRATKQVV
jgi:hypothetical protein